MYTPAPIKCVSDEEFRRRKDTSVRIYAYANRVLGMAAKQQQRKDFGYALFDKTGCLLKLYGSAEYLNWCEEHDIHTATLWDADSIGPSAVSDSLQTLLPCHSSAAQHMAPHLQDVEIYFSPLLLQEKDSQHFDMLGGIALLAPADAPVPEGKLICSSLGQDIVLHIFMAKELYDLYFHEPKGMLNIDINEVTGKLHILYHNEQIFRILGIPYEDLYFKKADSFFDPLPKNARLWEIIRTRTIVEDEHIPLSIRGKESTFVVSNVIYQQSHLNVVGMRLFISTPQGISNQVARHIGNNAVYSFSNIIASSPIMQSCINQAANIARSDSNVMITGESGVGKDIFAQAIHNASGRKDNPFIVLNCAAYPRDLLASELFGYDGGAYTGAKKGGNLGKFELAHTGTIFLDEIGDMPLDLQVMLLRVIEQKSFMRIGSNTVRNVDVKIIAATNADLKELMEKRLFRSDLYFRLCTLNLRLPPLRERGEDIILLSEHFISTITSRLQLSHRKILSDETKALILQLPWSGNVRELQNVMERVVQLIPHQVVTPQDLEMCLDFAVTHSAPTILTPSAPTEAPSSPRKRQVLTREEILQTLEACKYNRTLAAYALGISRKTFYRKLEEFHIEL